MDEEAEGNHVAARRDDGDGIERYSVKEEGVISLLSKLSGLSTALAPRLFTLSRSYSA